MMITTFQKQKFEADGFLVLESVLPTGLLQELRTEAHALSATAPQNALRVWHERALFRRSAFRRLLDVAPLIEAQEALLGPDVQLLALDLLMTRPGEGGIAWHSDVTFRCDQTLSINTALYLQDMTPEMGPLRVVPGSHRTQTLPELDAQGVARGSIEVPVRAGDAVLFDAALWHAGNRNNSNHDRVGVFAYFGRYFIKRMDGFFTQPLPAELQQTPDPLKRQLLGLGLRPGVASYHGDDQSYNRRGEAGIDFVD